MLWLLTIIKKLSARGRMGRTADPLFPCINNGGNIHLLFFLNKKALTTPITAPTPLISHY
jgi:hypothetical protein